MFGVLRSCGLKPDERRTWFHHSCGVCLALGRDYGQLARLATNYDAALLVALCEAQAAEPLPRTDHYCPLRPGGHATIHVASPATRYAAALATLMASVKIADHANDGDGFLGRVPRLSHGIAAKLQTQASHHAQAVGFAPNTLIGYSAAQTAVEAQPGQQFTVYSHPTEQATALAFAHTAQLSNCPANHQPLMQMGAMYGRIIYLLDSYRDYHADLAKRAFNPLAQTYQPSDIQPQAQHLFQQAHTVLAAALETLNCKRSALLNTLLLQHLPNLAWRTLSTPVDPEPAQQSGKTKRQRRKKDQQSSCCDNCDPCGSSHPNSNCCDCFDCCRIFRCGRCECCDGDGRMDCCDCNCCDSN